MKRKSLLFLLLMAIFVPWAANAQTTGCEAIGETSTNWGAGGFSGAGYVPVDTYYKYSYEQMVYDGSEMPTTITSISFKYKSSYSMTEKDDVDIYLGETTTATLSGWMSADDLTLVYSGALDFPASTDGSWVEFEFNQNEGSFSHDQSKYIVVVINDKSNGYPSSYYSSMYFCYETCASGAHKYLRNDSSGAYTVPPTTTANNASQYPIVRFCGTFPVICCPKPTDLTCTGTTTNPTTATFTWTNGGEETQWQLEYGTASDFSGASTVTINQSDLVNGAYTLTGLTAEQTYYARIKAYCPSCEPNYSDWSNTVNFKPTNAVTACEDFEGVTGTSYSTEGNMPEGWYPYTTATGTSIVAPHVCSGSSYNYYHSASQSLVFESGTNANGNAAYAVMPANTVDGDYVSLTFYTRVENTSYGTLQIGYVTAQNAAACNNFTPLASGTITSSTTIHKETIDVSSVPSDAFIAFKWQSTTGSYYACGVDDVCLSILPNPTPRPRNLQVSNITSSGATVSWQAPASATPTSYQYRYNNGINWTGWESTADLSVDLTLTASTPYTVQVKAIYDGVGESASIETDFTTLDDCAFPTSLMPYTVAGEGTKATLTWVKGYDEDAWVLEYATNNTFTEGLVTMTDGFTVEGNNVTANLTGLTAEQTYYARVMANCGTTTSAPSNVAEFTPTNYVDYTYNQDATSSYAYSYVPFYGSYVAYATHSRFIIPSTSLADIAGGTVKKLTFYSSTANADWGNATFKVYVAEVEASSFTSNPSTSTPFDWSEMTQVYSGSLSLANGMMEIVLDEPFVYSGTKNLMIGFEETNTGTNATASWYYKTVSNSCAYAYKSYGSATSFSTGRNGYSPKLTFNYLPTPYQKIAAINEGTIAATSAELTWTAPETTATITGYAYQYKLSSAAEWPTAWSNLAASATSVTLQPLTPGTSYDFQIKVLYGEHESAVNSTSFFTECAIVTAFPWKEDFEAYAAGDFNHPCWVNEHISGDGTNIFKVYTTANGSNTTHQLQLPDQDEGTLTKLRLPEMNLPNNNYQFVIDVYRSNSTYAVDLNPYEGIRVYASTDGNIDGATPLAFIPRQYDEENGSIPAEDESGWYTYELPIGIQGTCFIILRGESQFCTSTYMDNLTVEEIPTCARPTDLAKSDVTNHSATLTWTAGDPDQHNWQVAYSKTSFDPNTANFDLTTVETVDFTTGATCTYRMDKLFDAESTYYLYIRANCGTATEPDYGPWSRKGINLTTLVASPAPSNFTASNIGSQTADLVWTAGGGDYELSWDLYYVQSDDAPTAPTEETPAKKTVTTLPTTENPYTLDGLTEESRYYIWVRANHTINSVTTPSAWVALTDDYFTTLAACPTPTGLAYNNLTAVSADLSWVGSPDVTDYTVQYRTAAQIDPDNIAYQEHFTSQSLPNGWTRYSTLLTDDVLNGTTALTSTSTGWGSTTYALGEYNWKVNLYKSTYGGNCQYWMVTPSIAVGANNVLTFDVALTKYNSNDAPTTYPGTSSKFFVLISSDEMVTWTVLREWNNTGSNYVLNNIPNDGETISINLSAYNEKDVYIAFYGEQTESGTDNDLHIDDVVVAGSIPAGQWVTATDNVTTQSYRLNNLTGGIKYDAHVKSNCTSGEYCPEVSFTTLPAGTKVFVTAGEWGTATNWMPNGAPVITDEAILRANATIESGCVAQAKKITFQGSPTPTLTINDGGQLQTDNTVTATVKKNITGYGAVNEETNLGYYFISNPLNSTINSSSFASIGLITTNSDYDLYRWSTGEGADYLEWRNFKASSFNLQGGGYLYANAADVVLTFTGTVRANHERSGWTPTQASYSFGNWNLYGNPFVCNAYLVNSNNISKPYYKMNEAGDGFEAVIGEAIPPVTGLFYDASESGESVFFTRDLPAMSNQGHLNINMAQNVNMRGAKGSTDNAIIVFGESQQMGKFSFREGSSKVYIPMEGKDYAVVNAEGKTGEIPVNFKAEKNGSYTLSFTSQEVSFSYLHLIDNLTGNDVDLLANPSYNFDAQITDYAQRFKLVFATGSSVDGDSFGFINGSGNLCIFGIEGEATIQVIDILGHVVTSDTFSGSYERKLNVAPGVYMIRLINGNDVKVQKIVVR